MLETLASLKNNAMHWAQQGLEYKSRIDAWNQFTNKEPKISREQLLSVWLQPEAKALEEMYGLPPPTKSQAVHPAFQDEELKQKCHLLGVRSFPSTELDEEQERELALEIEEEREIQRPNPAMPADPMLHPHVLHLVVSGVLTKSSPAFRPAFPNEQVDRYEWSDRLFVTKDFSTTIKPHSTSSYSADDYMRPVHWVLSTTSPANNVLVILSPFEVNELLPQIRRSKEVRLHVYTPRITEAMKSAEEFDFFTLPSLPQALFSEREVVNQLNLFAGQLYLRDYEAYQNLCTFLGVICGKPGEDKLTVQLDGFIPGGKDRKALSPFESSPLPYLKTLIQFRRKGQSFGDTDMGNILRAKVVKCDKFSARSQPDAARRVRHPHLLPRPR
jgi:hypothetical protein